MDFARSVWMSAIVMIVAGVAAVNNPLAGEELRYRFKPGQKFQYEMTIAAEIGSDVGGQSTNTKTQQIFDIALTVKEVDAKGSATLVRKVDRVRLNMDLPQGKVDFDSQANKPIDGPLGTPVAEAIKAIIAGEMTQKLTAEGRLEDFKLSESLADFYKFSPQSAQLGLGESNLRSLASQTALEFPSRNLAKGDTWKKTEVVDQVVLKQKTVTDYAFDGTVAKDGKNYAKITSKPKISMEAKEDAQAKVDIKSQDFSNDILFDMALGQVSRIEGTNKMSLRVEFGGQIIEQTVSMKMTTKLTEAK